VPDAAAVLATALKHEVNLRAIDATTIGVSFDETSQLEDVDLLFK
jgi:glycine cleavage system pyridoxal-binding protein P